MNRLLLSVAEEKSESCLWVMVKDTEVMQIAWYPDFQGNKISQYKRVSVCARHGPNPTLGDLVLTKQECSCSHYDQLGNIKS